jgi:hypothetical protein
VEIVQSTISRAAILALAALALAGYVVGRGALQSGGHASASRSAIISDLLVSYPREWRRERNAPIGNLGLSESSAFTPGGREGGAGLLIGALPEGQPTPLPRALTPSLARIPAGAIVSLAEAQAFRYTGIAAPAFRGSLTVYAIPRAGAPTIDAVCFASPEANAFLARCGGVVAGMTWIGQAQGYELTPERAYAQHLAGVIADVDASRQRVAATRAAGATSAGVATLAAELGSRFARARDGLAGLEPPALAAAGQAALVRALNGASAAYAALAVATNGGRASAIAAARRGVGAAEAQVDEALAGFSLLGYGRTEGTRGGG